MALPWWQHHKHRLGYYIIYIIIIIISWVGAIFIAVTLHAVCLSAHPKALYTMSGRVCCALMFLLLMGHFTFLISLFAQRNHYVYSQASKSKLLLLLAFTCPQIFIIIILKGKEWCRRLTAKVSQEVKVIWQKAPHGGPIPRLGVTPGVESCTIEFLG